MGERSTGDIQAEPASGCESVTDRVELERMTPLDRSGAAGAKWHQMVSEQGYAVPGGNVNVPPDCVVSSCCVPSPQAAADDGVERSHPPGT
jgi:hypothetical protein